MSDSLPPLDPIDHMLDRLTWRAAFGDPVQRDDVTVIPVSAVTLGFGYGHGFGRGDEAVNAPTTTPGGGGIGGGGSVEPRGVLHIGPTGVRYEPIVNVNRVALLALPLVAWNVFWVARTIAAFAPRRESAPPEE